MTIKNFYFKYTNLNTTLINREKEEGLCNKPLFLLI